VANNHNRAADNGVHQYTRTELSQALWVDREIFHIHYWHVHPLLPWEQVINKLRFEHLKHIVYIRSNLIFKENKL
jgi:hypothetical protein